MKVVQFNDGFYGIRKVKWLTPGYLYWDFQRKEWVPSKQLIIRRDACKAEWEEAEMLYHEMLDRGEPV